MGKHSEMFSGLFMYVCTSESSRGPLSINVALVSEFFGLLMLEDHPWDAYTAQVKGQYFQCVGAVFSS